jgi:hypothetical protein
MTVGVGMGNLAAIISERDAGRQGNRAHGHIGYNRGFDSPPQNKPKIMEAERINALSALLNDLTSREAELRRYL